MLIVNIRVCKVPFTSVLFTNIRCNDNENLVAVHVTKLQFCLAESELGEGRVESFGPFLFVKVFLYSFDCFLSMFFKATLS